MRISRCLVCCVVVVLVMTSMLRGHSAGLDELARSFTSPPASARPWVYWFWMDGNSSREGITADFEAMKRAGIGGVIHMEVDVGVPRGPVAFMSKPWRELFRHAAAEAQRLGLEIDLSSGPGWTGSGGPWVKPERSMQKVVFSETTATGARRVDTALAQPHATAGFYRDIAVLAFPTPTGKWSIPNLQEKALYRRGHYSSEQGVRSYLAVAATQPNPPSGQILSRQRTVDLTAKMNDQGQLSWEAPDGDWTILRFGHTSTGANTRPAPMPGLGLECDKLSKAALDAHCDAYLGPLLSELGSLAGKSLTSLHIDSWEMGPQNWTEHFREEFGRLRGYDPVPYLPVLAGYVIDSVEISERFLWDLRQTVQDLIVENHARHLRTIGQRHGLRLSIQPYDGTPCDDVTYGAVADVPMCEFWANCFETWFSCFEATSIAHTYGRSIVAAEAFTSDDSERWSLYPGSMKPLGDWALCQGINRFAFHRYAHQPWLDRTPGMTMGPYGIHHERTQTWWEMTPDYHTYLARCQHVLQQGLAAADICYLTPEGAPHVFRPPSSATVGSPPDRRGYSFDACTPEVLLTRMSVSDSQLRLPDGMSYRVLVLPRVATMSPALVRRIRDLAQAGATIVGAPPKISPSLQGYPACDDEVRRLAQEIWGEQRPTGDPAERPCGKGRVIWDDQPATSSTAAALGVSLAKARWIWHASDKNAATSAPPGKRYFRRSVDLGETSSVESARVFMAADNRFELAVNGLSAGAGRTFRVAREIDIGRLLRPGHNMLTVTAINEDHRANPAGLIGAMVILLRDGSRVEVVTDGQWEGVASVGEAWPADSSATEAWCKAAELGGPGMGPWGQVGEPVIEAELYPDYSLVASVLGRAGVAPDFEAPGGLRATHRRIGDLSCYFVSSPSDQWVSAECVFRVAGLVPEIWDPRSGSRTRALCYHERDGRTSLPLCFEPAGSRFVVFRRGSRAELPSDPVVEIRRNGRSILPKAGRAAFGLPACQWDSGLVAWQPGRYEIQHASGSSRSVVVDPLPAPVDLSRDWQVVFQPGRGAPERIRLDALGDLSTHADPAVRYFSGVTTYSKTFEWDGSTSGAGSRLYLDLGEVAVMARVRVNGRDLGVEWTPPFRVDIMAQLHPGANHLEIEVANLWQNRLIGDSALAPEKRIAWTTWNPFSPEDALPRSGLLGPVRLVATRGLYP